MAKTIAYDTETTGLDLHGKSEAFAFSMCDWNGNAEGYRFDRRDGRRNLERVEKLMGRAVDGDVSLVMHNAKFDLGMTDKLLGWNVSDVVTGYHDTAVQSHLLQNDAPSHQLKDVAYVLAGFPTDDEDEVKAFLAKNKHLTYQDVPQYIMDRYMVNDSIRTMLLHRFFYPKIQASKSLSEIYNYEVRLLLATLRMERRGVMVNHKRCHTMVESLRSQAAQDLKFIESKLRTKFPKGKLTDANIAWILYDKLKIKPFKFTAKAKAPSTDKDVLGLLYEETKHPVLERIIRYRAYKAGATTLESYVELSKSDCIIHPNIHTTAAVTGRESISNPSLQNVRKSQGVLFPIPVRSVFRPRPEHILIPIDYKGIELRLLVHYAQEQELIDIMNADGDVHEPACVIFYGDTFKNATGRLRKELRNNAKAANFALPYGASAEKIAKVIGCDIRTAYRLVREWNTRFPNLSALNKNITREVIETGGVLTTFGRFLRVARRLAYTGTNYKIQGTGAEIVKRAQVRVDDYFRNDLCGEVHILFPIHDEIIIEYPRSEMKYLPDVLKNVKALMTDFPMFHVPIDIEISIAKSNWENKREYDLVA